MTATTGIHGGAQGGIRTLLRVEGLILLATCTALYFVVAGTPVWLFFVLFLAPDLTFVAFAGGRRVGAIAYNAAHTTIGPLLLLVTGLLAGPSWLVALALIWGAHIGADRALGYGLRYPASFEHTHLGAVGATRKAQASTTS